MKARFNVKDVREMSEEERANILDFNDVQNIGFDAKDLFSTYLKIYKINNSELIGGSE